MSLLQNQIATLEDQLATLSSSSENKVAMQEYEVIIKHIDTVGNVLKQQYVIRNLLGKLPGDSKIVGVKEVESEQIERALSVINEFIDKWKEEDYKARQDDSLDNTRQSLDKLNNDLLATSSQVWNDWLNGLIARFETSDIELDSQEDVPHLQNNIKLYRESRERYYELTKGIPNDEETIKIISSVTNDLESLRGNMDFNLPNEVKKFFKKINDPISGNQFTLAMLTPEIIQWLKDNNELDKFVVKRKSMY